MPNVKWRAMARLHEIAQSHNLASFYCYPSPARRFVSVMPLIIFSFNSAPLCQRRIRRRRHVPAQPAVAAAPVGGSRGGLPEGVLAAGRPRGPAHAQRRRQHGLRSGVLRLSDALVWGCNMYYRYRTEGHQGYFAHKDNLPHPLQYFSWSLVNSIDQNVFLTWHVYIPHMKRTTQPTLSLITSSIRTWHFKGNVSPETEREIRLIRAIQILSHYSTCLRMLLTRIWLNAEWWTTLSQMCMPCYLLISSRILTTINERNNLIDTICSLSRYLSHGRSDFDDGGHKITIPGHWKCRSATGYECNDHSNKRNCLSSQLTSSAVEVQARGVGITHTGYHCILTLNNVLRCTRKRVHISCTRACIWQLWGSVPTADWWAR